MKRSESHNHVCHNVINTVNTSLGIAEWQKVGKQGTDDSIKSSVYVYTGYSVVSTTSESVS